MFSSCSIASFPPILLWLLLSPLFAVPPPFLPPGNSTRSTPVSRLLADRDCLRPGLDFPVSASPLLLYLAYLDTHSSSTHSHVSHLPHNLTPPVWFLRMCVFLENAHLPCALCCYFTNLAAFFLFTTSDWFLFLLLLLTLPPSGATFSRCTLSTKFRGKKEK